MSRDGNITLVINREQADYLRRLILDHVAKQARYLDEAAGLAATNARDESDCEDAQLCARNIRESTDMLDMLGWSERVPPERRS